MGFFFSGWPNGCLCQGLEPVSYVKGRLRKAERERKRQYRRRCPADNFRRKGFRLWSALQSAEYGYALQRQTETCLWNCLVA